MDERIVAYGGAVKALTADGTRIGGYLVERAKRACAICSANASSARPISRSIGMECPLLFHHGMDDGVGAAKIGTIRRLSRDDKGLWMEAIS